MKKSLDTQVPHKKKRDPVRPRSRKKNIKHNILFFMFVAHEDLHRLVLRHPYFIV